MERTETEREQKRIWMWTKHSKSVILDIWFQYLKNYSRGVEILLFITGLHVGKISKDSLRAPQSGEFLRGVFQNWTKYCPITAIWVKLTEKLSEVTYVKMLYSYVIRNYTFGDHTDTIKHENDCVSSVGYFRSFFGF